MAKAEAGFWRNDDEQEESDSVGLSRMENTYHWNHGSLKAKNLLAVEKGKRIWTICLPGSLMSLSFLGISFST